MHLVGIVASIATGIYTLSWAWTLYREGNKAGAVWSVIFALASTGTCLYYFYQHGFLP